MSTAKEKPEGVIARLMGLFKAEKQTMTSTVSRLQLSSSVEFSLTWASKIP